MRSMIKTVTVLAVLLCLCVTAFAHPVPDFSRTGTLNLTLHSGETLVGGGSVTLYRVGDLQEDNGNYSFVLSGDFVQCTASVEDPTSTEAAKQLQKYAKDYSISGITNPVDAEGKVSFLNLELGLYLVSQETPADGWNPAAPFLISVPQQKDGEYMYEIDASPKVELTKVPPKTDPDEPKLPQTGQLNWPVPVLALCGMLLIAAGVVLCSRRKEAQ